MKIGIIGTRGIPNHYGGFEQLAEYLSVDLVQLGHDVWVYNSSNHPYKESSYNGVQLIHCTDPEHRIGTAGQFIYDLNCILDARRRGFDVLLQLGYTSSSIWHFLLPRKSVVITNMDGLEWKRSKYSKRVQSFLKYAERWAVQSSDILIADSVAIQQYLQNTYGKHSHFIAYGAIPFGKGDESVIQQLGLSKHTYSLLIARFEPENNLEMIIQGYIRTSQNEPLVLVGSYQNAFGQYLHRKYGNHNLHFLGPIYNLNTLNNLRYFCKQYFHGHSVGGTNPSLLEAMASSAPICAHANDFNKAILGPDALYFSNSTEVSEILTAQHNMEEAVMHNLQKINQLYTWPQITKAYEMVMKKGISDARQIST